MTEARNKFFDPDPSTKNLLKFLKGGNEFFDSDPSAKNLLNDPRFENFAAILNKRPTMFEPLNAIQLRRCTIEEE